MTDADGMWYLPYVFAPDTCGHLMAFAVGSQTHAHKTGHRQPVCSEGQSHAVTPSLLGQASPLVMLYQ